MSEPAFLNVMRKAWLDKVSGSGDTFFFVLSKDQYECMKGHVVRSGLLERPPADVPETMVFRNVDVRECGRFNDSLTLARVLPEHTEFTRFDVEESRDEKA